MTPILVFDIETIPDADGLRRLWSLDAAVTDQGQAQATSLNFVNARRADVSRSLAASLGVNVILTEVPDRRIAFSTAVPVRTEELGGILESILESHNLVLVLPPSVPFGGMENPLVTFATPTILAGDRSLVSLIAHELAHSWSGNLVTNATWRDFWLNEGVTTYVESRIMEAIYGKRVADMLLVLERRDLQDEITRLGGPTSPDTVLHVNLQGRDPDAGMTERLHLFRSLDLDTDARWTTEFNSVVGL
jgi:hypothetical protein